MSNGHSNNYCHFNDGDVALASRVRKLKRKMILKNKQKPQKKWKNKPGNKNRKRELDVEGKQMRNIRKEYGMP